MTAWTVEALAAKGYGPDGSRVPARQNSTSPAGDRAGHHAQAAPQGVNAEASAGSMEVGDVCAPRRTNPMPVMGEPPAVEEQNATGSDRRVGVALRAPETTGLSGLQSPIKRLSSRAIAKLQPEQRLQIEVVAHWRPRLRPDARLLGINGELPGGGKLQALRAAVRRDMGYVRGCSDLVCCRPGHTLWLELKAGSDQSERQAAFADWAHSIGHGYAVATNIDDAGVLLRIHGMLA